MKNINLGEFCEAQKNVWYRIKKEIEENGKCLKCASQLIMVSKWRADCTKCETKHKIKKPKYFPKNMLNTRNWKATCSECGGKMDFHKGGAFGAYICRKCNNVLEV